MMPKSTEEIVAHAEELAKNFVDPEVSDLEIAMAAALADVHRAVVARADAEVGVRQAVATARGAGASWSVLGGMLGTTGEAARQRFGAARAAS